MHVQSVQHTIAPYEIKDGDPVSYRNVERLLRAELRNFECQIGHLDDGFLHAEYLIAHDETEWKGVEVHGRWIDRLVRDFEDAERKPLGFHPAKELEWVGYVFPGDRILGAERRLVQRRIVGRARDSCQVDLLDSRRIGRTKDRSDIVDRSHVVHHNSY